MAEILKIDKIEDIKNFNDDNIVCAISVISEFWDVHSCAIIKNAIPIGVGLSSNPYDAKLKALDCNPVEAIGETIAFSKEIDKSAAQSLSKMNFSTIIATQINKDAKKYLEKSRSKIIELGFRLDVYKKTINEQENTDLTPKGFKVATKLKPTQEQVEDMVFAWKVSKHTRSNSAVVVKDLKTVGICQGETARVDAIEKALDRACENSKDAVLVTDGFLSSAEGIQAAIQARIAGIIQPGLKDKQLIKTADKYELVVITTGIRQFRNQ